MSFSISHFDVSSLFLVVKIFITKFSDNSFKNSLAPSLIEGILSLSKFAS